VTIKAVKTGWQVNIQPGGRGAKRLKKTLPTKAEAIAWERHIRAKVQTTPEWTPPKKDIRKLSELCDAWYKHHGMELRAGKNTYSRLLAMCEAMENPRAETFAAKTFADYRATRMENGISANNMNREHAYLRAVFNELIRLGEWKRENPLKLLRAFKIQERELKYLSLEEIRTLLDALQKGRNKHALMVAKVCLATGARWDEAETLRKSQVKNGQIQFVKTKSRKTRVVPIAPDLEVALLEHHAEYGNGERLRIPRKLDSDSI
jgi:integrase